MTGVIAGALIVAFAWLLFEATQDDYESKQRRAESRIWTAFTSGRWSKW
jgi:hypothetical protein